MKVLVTGGAGFIGSKVAQKIARQGHNVIIYDVGVWDNKEDRIEYVKGDIFDVSNLTPIVNNCDAIIHMIGLADARTAQEHPQLSFDLNVRSLQTILECMRGNREARLIVPSSAAIYGAVKKSPVTEDTVPNLGGVYPYHKYVAEKIAESYSYSYGIHVTVLRLFNVYGSHGQGILNILLNKAIKGEAVTLFGEKQKRDFIHINEVADVFSKVIETNGGFQVYNVGTGIGRSIEDLVNIVKEFFPSLKVEFGESKGQLYDSVADISKLRQAIGFDPDPSDSNLRELVWRKCKNAGQMIKETTVN